MGKYEQDFYLYFIRSRGTGHNHTQTVWEFTEFYLDGPFPLVGRGLLHQGLPWFPLWHLPGERQLTLRLQTEHMPFGCHVFFHVKISPDTKTINVTVPFLKRNNIFFSIHLHVMALFSWPLFEASELKNDMECWRDEADGFKAKIWFGYREKCCYVQFKM